MKASLIGVLFAFLTIGGIYYFTSHYQHSQMEDFARERDMELVDSESRGPGHGADVLREGRHSVPGSIQGQSRQGVALLVQVFR